MALERPIYLDHHATTPVDARVMEAMLPYFTEAFGNASSSTHRYGWTAEAAVEDARERIAAAIGADDPAEIVFTSGTTESDNLALKGIARAGRRRGDHLVTTAIEHPAVLDSCDALEAEGFSVTRLPVDADGLVDPGAVEAALTDRTLLVSVMAANSEVGVLEPLAEIAEVCARNGVPLHSDAAQAVGRVPFDVNASGLDLASFCAHKLYGPKGIGALYLRRRRPRIRIEPLLHGGGHEGGLRSGTLPVPLIVGFAAALELARDLLEEESRRLAALRDRLWERLSTGLEGVQLNGHPTRRLPGNLNVGFEGVEAGAVMSALKDVALSSGSACASASGEPSHVLRALGRSDAEARSALRFGLGRSNTEAEIDHVASRVCREVEALRAHHAPATAARRARNS
jgi:cysteine desulfurase